MSTVLTVKIGPQPTCFTKLSGEVIPPTLWSRYWSDISDWAEDAGRAREGEAVAELVSSKAVISRAHSTAKLLVK